MLAAIKKAREQAGLSTREVSRRLGRSVNFAQRIESGERMLDACEFVDYVRMLEADPIEIMKKMAKYSHWEKED